jgi:hypothetical protein
MHWTVIKRQWQMVLQHILLLAPWNMPLRCFIIIFLFRPLLMFVHCLTVLASILPHRPFHDFFPSSSSRDCHSPCSAA